MTLRLRLLAAFLFVLAGPLAVALLIADAPLADELLIFGCAVLIGIALSVMAASVIARPVQELAGAADRVARGESDTRLPVRGSDEFARLAESFNALGDVLRRRAEDVESSRDEVRDSVRRLGEALRSTHDLMKLLSVVLETALAAVKGRSGAVFLLTGRRSELMVKVGRHLDPSIAERALGVGQGLAGWVAEHRTSARVPSPDAPRPADPEPDESTAIAVPLETESQLLGVLAIYGRRTLEPFRVEDLEAIESLARQAGVGIDNILLHQQNEQMALTDGLTGIWNSRRFRMRLDEEFKRAKRSGDPVSLLVLDIDDFKTVNDRYGHQRGDAILIELASRVAQHVREVDMLARYGGEEFVVILPDIDVDGAAIAAERIRREIGGRPFGEEGERPLRVTVSIGHATNPNHGATEESLLGAADRAMYVAKSRGKNRVVGADELGEPTLAPDPARP
jgi:diguanylate cyclase (GGDEF)-like protein